MDHHTSKFTQGLNMPVLAVIAAVGTLVVWVTVVGVQAYYETGVRAEEQTKLIQRSYLDAASNDALKKLHEEQLYNVRDAVIDPAKQAVIDHYGSKSKKEPATPDHATEPRAH